LSRFLCLSFFAAAKKVSAAPHRGNTNRPITNQGKAKEVRTRKGQRHKNTTKTDHQQIKKRPESKRREGQKTG
jgi:hypothetical protein